jgi:hypothetical protein
MFASQAAFKVADVVSFADVCDQYLEASRIAGLYQNLYQVLRDTVVVEHRVVLFLEIGDVVSVSQKVGDGKQDGARTRLRIILFQ